MKNVKLEAILYCVPVDSSQIVSDFAYSLQTIIMNLFWQDTDRLSNLEQHFHFVVQYNKNQKINISARKGTVFNIVIGLEVV